MSKKIQVKLIGKWLDLYYDDISEENEIAVLKHYYKEIRLVDKSNKDK